MRVLALDMGTKRVGIAVSDPDGRVATPLKVVTDPLGQGAREIVALVKRYEVGTVLVGLPVSLSGDEGEQARLVRSQAEKLARLLPVPVEYWDERLTTEQAHRAMMESGVPGRKKKELVDMIAATIILQGYLDRTAGP